MRSIKINLENCYGINKLNYEFVFEAGHKTFSVYSPNGVMKTSLAKTFDDFSKNRESKDLVFADRETKRKIQKDDGELPLEEVFVIQPYDATFFSEKISVLLVNQELRDQHEKIHKNIDEQKNRLLTQLASLSGLNSETIDKEISKVFMQDEEDKFFKAMESIKPRLEDELDDFNDIKYSLIFSVRALAFFDMPDVKENIQKYVDKYDELIKESTYFRKGIFNHWQAEDVAKQLEKNGFFNADHSVLLKDSAQKISTKKELQDVIDIEKNRILGDVKLKSMFGNLDDKLNNHQDLRKLREYLSNHIYILGQLKNIESFKAKVWLSYIKKEKELYDSTLATYSKSKEQLACITKKAQEERTEWLEVMEIFNERFHVPFKLTVENKTEVMLDNVIPTIAFEFANQDQHQPIEEKKLLEVLSQGEKRALYILNIIFEIQARKKTAQETLFIVDDIADSFDYKNKYAIIEYLQDVSKETHFYQIILTHNFDFHRTISSRLDMERSNILNTLKTDTAIKIVEEKYQKNPFTDWRKNLNDAKKLIASIPFVRNLAEFSGDDDSYNKLTSFLHVKADTRTLTIGNLKEIFDRILKTGTNQVTATDEEFMHFLEKTTSSIVDKKNSNIELEGKIVLAISIRLMTEKFILDKIPDDRNIETNQTYKLAMAYKNRYPKEVKIIEKLNKVLLMTPENIHVNSFMYEPIIDMDGEHLVDLYHAVKCMDSQQQSE